MAKQKFLLSLAVGLYPFLVGAPALAQASFSSQVVTTQPPPATGCLQPTAATSFLTIDNTVYLYFAATITSSDSLTSNWLAPDGTVVPGVAWAVNTGNLCFPGASLNIASLPVSQFGSWQARVYDSGKLLFSVPFTVTGYNSQVVTTQAPPSGSCAQPAAAASFPTADNTVYLYFEATIAAGDSLASNWLAPDGTVVPGPTWNPNTGHFCFPGASLSISSLPAGQLGSWQARVYDNGRLFFSVPFTVTALQTTGTAITVTNDASFSPQISPGSLVALFGNGNVLATTTISGTNPPLPTSANGTSVTINGMLCPLIFVSPSQINLQAPMELQPGTATVVVSNNGQGFSATAPVLTAAPGIFTTDFYANGGVAILQDGTTFTTLNAGNPAVPSENVTMYFTGIGPVTNNPGTGAAASGGSSLSYATSAVSLTVNGVSVQPSFTGLVAGIVSTGQVNFQIPANTPSGNSIPVVLTVGGVSSKTVHISVTGGATVAPATYSLTTSTSGAGSGTVGYSPAGTSCGSGCLTFAAGTAVTVTAAPNTGSTFAGWSGACSGTASCTVTMNSNQAVTAAFNLTGNSNPTSTIIYQTGFEPPTFGPGTINGQDSWSAFVAPISPEIETTTVKTGVQAVGITPVPSTTGVIGAGRSASYNAANQILTFTIDANLSATGTPSFWTVLNTSYNSSSPNIGINIDQSGQIHIFIMGTDNPTGVSIARGVWNHYELDVNFINDTVSAFYNGGPALQVAAFSPTGTTLGGYQFYSQGGIPLVGTDTGYFDNLSVTASAASAPTLVSIAVTPAAPAISLGATLQLTASGTYINGSTQNLTGSVSWTSSNTAIATVNTSGLVTGVSAGSTTITATSGSVTGTVSLTVGSSTQGPSLTITTSGTGSGTVSSSPAGTSCGTGCLSFSAGTTVTLTETPNTGSAFAGWSGACSGTGSCTVTMNSSQAVSASFDATVNPLTMPTLTTVTSGAGGGAVSSSPAGTPCGPSCLSFAAGTVVTLTATPNTASIFAGWFGACSGTGSCTVTMNSSPTVVAAFSQAGGQSPSVTSISSASLAPLNFLTITGSGFAPAAQVQVTFSNGSGFSASVPATLTTSTEVLVAVPPFLDLAGDLGAGPVNISVSQASSAGATITSNVLGGFQIQAPAASPLPAGSLTLALLTAISQATNDLETTVSATPLGTPNMLTALASQTTILQGLLPQVQSVMNGVSTTFAIGQINGSNVNVASQDLETADQFVVGLLTTFAGPVPDLSGLGVPSDVPGAANPIQTAAQATLNVALSPGTSAPQLNQALATFVGSFAQADPNQAGVYMMMAAGALSAVAPLAEGAVLPRGAQSGIGAKAPLPRPAVIGTALLVGAGEVIAEGFGALLAPWTIGTATVMTAGTLAEACAEGKYTVGHGTQGVVQGIALELTKAGVVGAVLDTLNIGNNIWTIVVNGGCGPSLLVAPLTLPFSATQGEANPPSQTLRVNYLEGAILWGAEVTSGSWLSIDVNRTYNYGRTPGAIAVSVNTQGLTAGLYSGSIEVNSFYANSSVTVPVELTLKGGVLTGLTLAPYGSTAPGTAALTGLGGTPVTGILTFSSPVQAGQPGGSMVYLRADNAAATVPSSIDAASGIPVNPAAGLQGYTFTIYTSAVQVQTVVHIYATMGSIQEIATLTLTPPITLSGLTLSASAVTGGNSVTGTATLSAAAPSGGTAVMMQSSNGAAQVPSSVTVAAGQTSASFTIGTSLVTAQTTATISAALGGVVKTAVLTVNPQSPPPPPTGSNVLYCVDTETWAANKWNTSWAGSGVPGAYPFGTNDNIVTYTYSCASQSLPNPCGAICHP